MNTHRGPRPGKQFSIRPLSLEFDRVRNGLSRHFKRSVGLARDVEPHGSYTAAEILKLEQALLLTLERLESRILHD